MGYAHSSVDELGDETFRKVRRALGITAFGANVVVLQPGVVGRAHYHEEQDELYFVHKGKAIFDLPGDRVELGPGGLLHVESTTPRRVTNPGPDELVMLIVGAKDGYVGRDGAPAPPNVFLRDVEGD
jgi:mannose-6-phosphate isomerase-like protein (cupin superfamily)